MNIFITQGNSEKAQRTTEKNSATLCEAFFITRRTYEALCENPLRPSVKLSSVVLCDTFFLHREPRRNSLCPSE